MDRQIDMAFANKELAKVYIQHRPLPPKDLIKRIVEFTREKLEEDSQGNKTSLKLCLDIGCGSGQATKEFAYHFKHVIGVDVSPAQLEIANQKKAFDNVCYMLGTAENLTAENGSVDLISTGCSVHWFNLEKYYEEVDRVLRPGGVVACFCYRPPIPFYADKCLRNEKEEIWDSLSPYWPECFKHVNTDYANLPHIYPDGLHLTGFSMEHTGTLEGFLKFFTTCPSYSKMKEAEGGEAAEEFLKQSKQKLLSAMDTDLVDPLMTWRFDFYLRMCRKPIS